MDKQRILLQELFIKLASHDSFKHLYSTPNEAVTTATHPCASTLRLQKRQSSLSTQTQKCYCCENHWTSTSKGVRFAHPIWPDDEFCNECRTQPRCVVCERRLNNIPFYLDAETKTAVFYKKKIGCLPHRNPLWICAECHASGVVDEKYNIQELVNDVLQFSKLDPRIGITFPPQISFRYTSHPSIPSDSTCPATSTHVAVMLVDMHLLSSPHSAQSHTARHQAPQSTCQGWKEDLVFGRFQVSRKRHRDPVNHTEPFTRSMSLRIDSIKDVTNTLMKQSSLSALQSTCMTLVSNFLNFASCAPKLGDANPLSSYVFDYPRYDAALNFSILSPQSTVSQKKSFHPEHTLKYETLTCTTPPKKLYKPPCVASHTSSASPTSLPSSHPQTIFIVNSMPVDIFASTLIHEIIHAYIFAARLKCTLVHEEGICNAACIYYVLVRAAEYASLLNQIDTLYRGHHQCTKKNMHCIKHTFLHAWLYKLFPPGTTWNPRDRTADTCTPTTTESEAFPPSSFVPVVFEDLECSTLLRILRERLILKQRLCVYRFKRVAFCDTQEYRAAIYVFPALFHSNVKNVLDLLCTQK